MVTGSFQVGQRLFFKDAECRVLRKAEPDVWTIEDLATGRWREETTNALLAQWSDGSLRFPGAMGSDASEAHRRAYQDAAVEAFRQSYPDELWRRAQARLVYVRRLKAVPITADRIKPLIDEIHKDERIWKDGQVFDKAPHFTTVAKWRRAYDDAGQDIRALCEKGHDKGNSEPRYDSVVEALADDIIETQYLTVERPSIESCLETLRGRVARLNQERLPSEQLLRPTYAYLKRKITRLSKYDICVARYGKRLADIRFRAAGTGARAAHPLARASIDHCRLDLVVVDEATGLPLGRPWLTLVIDERTRYILGYYLGFEEPSAVSASRAIRNAIMPKQMLLSKYSGVKNDWDAWGVMDVLVMDNGMEFHGGAIENGVGRFGIIVQFCPRRKPWYKGKIERFFGTLNKNLLASLPGKTFSNVLEKLDYDAAKHSVIGLETLREILLTWVVDIYHQKPHRALSKSPATSWKEEIQSVDRFLPPTSISIETAFSRSLQRRLTHKGIEYDSLLYNSSDLRALRELYGSEINVEIRVMDDDLSALLVESPDSREIIRVPALDQTYATGLTRWQHGVCKRYQRRIQEDEAQDIGLYEARQRIVGLVDGERIKGKKSSKCAARFMEKDVHSPVPPAIPGVSTPDLSCQPIPNIGTCSGAMAADDDDDNKWLPNLGSRRIDNLFGEHHEN